MKKELKKIEYRGYDLYSYDENYFEVGKKIIEKEYVERRILKNTKRNFVEIIEVDKTTYVLKENRNEHIIPQRKLMTLFKKGEALNTLVNLTELIERGIDNFVTPYLVINKRKNGMIIYSILIMENINGIENREYLNEIIELMIKLHKLGVYHGDFNPGNFLIENGNIRIIDTQGKKMKFFNYRAHYDMLTMKMDSYQEMKYPYKKDFMYYFVYGVKKLKKLKVVEVIKKKKKELRGKGWKI